MSPQKWIFTQIDPYFLSLFELFRPIISVFCKRFFDIFRYFSALLSSTFSIFWTYNKCDFDFFLGKRGNGIFSSNCVWLSPIFRFLWPILFELFRPIISVFCKRFFDIFRYFSALLSSTFSIFGPTYKCDFDFFFLGKRGNMLFLAWIAPDYHLLFDFSGRYFLNFLGR